MKFELNVVDIAIAIFTILVWLFSPIRDRLFINTFKSDVNRPILKKVIDEMYSDQLEEHDDMKEAIQNLTKTLENSTIAIERFTESIVKIEEKMERVSQEVSYMKGVLDQSVDRRAKPRI